MLKAATPVVWFVNLFVRALLKLLRVEQTGEVGTTLSQEELRSLVLEGQYFRGKHRAMLANLLDLESVTVDDVMTPRNQIHALDLADRPSLIAQQLATSYHTRLPACEGALDNIVGIVHLKQVVQLQRAGDIGPDELRPILRPAYFVPAGTPLLAQLQQFQSDRERLGLVVDEYGELVGLVTIEDIIEEIIGDFTTQAPDGTGTFQRGADGAVVVDGLAPLRTLNRKLGTQLSGGRPEDPERAHRGATGRDTRGRHARRGRRPGHRGAADTGPWRKSRAAAPAGRAPAGRAFTKRRRAGIIGRISFMRLE